MKKINWKLVVNNLSLCGAVAKKISPLPSNITLDELIWGPGITTLIKCSQVWRPNNGTKFSTYSWISLSRSMKKFIIKYPQHLSLDAHDFVCPYSTKIESKSEVYNIMSKLELFDRLILIMRYWRNMSFLEISKELNCSSATVWEYEQDALEHCRLIVES